MLETKRSQLDLSAITSLFFGAVAGLFLHQLQTATTDQFNFSQHQGEFEEYEYLLSGIEGGKEMHRAVNLTKVYGVDAAENRERSDRPTFQKNEPVEIYGPTSTLAFPAIVDSVTYDGKYVNTFVTTDYDVNGLVPLPIQASYVHRYEMYPVGTRAMCGRDRRKVRGSDKSQVPCLVKSGISGKFGGFEYADTYGVVYLDGFASEVIIDHLPFSRVQRYLDQAAIEPAHPKMSESRGGTIAELLRKQKPGNSGQVSGSQV